MEKRMKPRCPGKTAWPELVGKDGNRAAVIIEKENKHVTAIVLKYATPVPRDLRCDRVWVWVDENNVVIDIPRVR
ncbi:proteinase inhibitor-like [Manihot esculenta]|uniref:Uncharacterized protein n=1 Tax=Manihot esculenta TaxID=3983 RepID=A0ACB7HP66_MANES|nr:proteinase inhibitor-like [Manihot esculenta]KAG8653956.1 hypothetical protein MANES_05G086337v8 [Manihot esculenta]